MLVLSKSQTCVYYIFFTQFLSSFLQFPVQIQATVSDRHLHILLSLHPFPLPCHTRIVAAVCKAVWIDEKQHTGTLSDQEMPCLFKLQKQFPRVTI